MELKIYVLFITLCSAVAATDVLVFTDSNFQNEVSRYDVILVEFYAPWCGHCKQLAPEYEKAATILKKFDPPVPLAKIDCTVETKTCSKYGVSGYPTLKIFKNGQFSKEYDKERETDAIVKTMSKEVGPISRKLETVEDAQTFLSKDSVGIIGFYPENSNEEKAFLKVADQLSYLRCAHTNSEEIKKELNQTEPGVVLYRPKVLQNQFEEAIVRTTETGTVKLKLFLEAEALGLCGERNQVNAEYFGKPVIVAYFNVDYVKDAKGTNYWRNRIMKVGKKLRDEGNSVYFGISHVDEMSRELDECDIQDRGGEKPVVCAWDSKNRKYRMDTVFSMESFELFVRAFLSGQVTPIIKSEPIPVTNDEPVKVVVADSFNDIVNDDEKDVLIEYYAPWCGHCKTLAPKYEELARKFKREKNIVIAKMDATSNDVPPPYEVSGFPTIYFAPKGKKNTPKRYDGEREVDDLIKYLAKEATESLIGYDREGNRKPKKKKEKTNDKKTEL